MGGSGWKSTRRKPQGGGGILAELTQQDSRWRQARDPTPVTWGWPEVRKCVGPDVAEGGTSSQAGPASC